MFPADGGAGMCLWFFFTILRFLWTSWALFKLNSWADFFANHVNLLMAAFCRVACHVTSLKLASQTWQRVLCTPGLNPKRIFGMWWHGRMTADKPGATVWHCHVNMGPNLWGTFPAIYWIYAKKNEGLQAKWGVSRSWQGGQCKWPVSTLAGCLIHNIQKTFT